LETRHLEFSVNEFDMDDVTPALKMQPPGANMTNPLLLVREQLSGSNATQRRIFVAVQPSMIDLLRAKRALDRREFDEAERHLRRARDIDAESAEARSLMGVLHERLGEHHAAYQCYKLALKIDRHDPIS
jgi:Flp pilus assembly protein TadD